MFGEADEKGGYKKQESGIFDLMKVNLVRIMSKTEANFEGDEALTAMDRALLAVDELGWD